MKPISYFSIHRQYRCLCMSLGYRECGMTGDICERAGIPISYFGWEYA